MKAVLLDIHDAKVHAELGDVPLVEIDAVAAVLMEAVFYNGESIETDTAVAVEAQINFAKDRIEYLVTMAPRDIEIDDQDSPEAT